VSGRVGAASADWRMKVTEQIDALEAVASLVQVPRGDAHPRVHHRHALLTAVIDFCGIFGAIAETTRTQSASSTSTARLHRRVQRLPPRR